MYTGYHGNLFYKDSYSVEVHVHHVVDRARVNGTTRYSPEAPAEGLYQVGLFMSGLSYLYHGYFLKIPSVSS